MVLAAGCDSGPKAATVTGQVKVGGKPVDAGMIAFIPADGQTYQADIAPDGTYRVDNVPLGDAVVLVHRPPHPAADKVMKETNAPPPPPPSPIPEKYGDLAKSDLRYTVKAGDNKYDPDLKR
jgi:hypothetical protein